MTIHVPLYAVRIEQVVKPMIDMGTAIPWVHGSGGRTTAVPTGRTELYSDIGGII
jgi:hypothetical protein